MDTNRLAVTEANLTAADRLWRTEMKRTLGPDAVLLHGFGPGGEGEPGTGIRRTFEARRMAVAAWRHARRTTA